jgi:hypothetical protein
MIYGLGVLALVVGLEHRSMMCVVLCEFSGASVINFNPASFVGIGRVLTVRVIVHKCVHKEYGFEKARGVKAMALIHLWFIGGEIVHLWYIGGELIQLWYIEKRLSLHTCCRIQMNKALLRTYGFAVETSHGLL